MSVVCACLCMSMCIYVQVTVEARGIASPGVRVRSSCELPNMSLGTKLGFNGKVVCAVVNHCTIIFSQPFLFKVVRFIFVL